MPRLAIALARGMAITALLLGGLSQQPAQAAPRNSTPICSNLGTSTWTVAGSPYIVCGAGATVVAGATLTIDPGVTVQFDTTAGNRNLVIMGALRANGTVTQTITFTSTSLIPTAGAWGGLSVIGVPLTPAVASLSYTTLDYGGVAGSYGAALYADQAVVTVTNSLVRHSAGNGIYASLSTRLDVHDTSFIGNGQHAIELAQPSTDLLMSGLAASGNGVNGVYLSGSAIFPGQHRLSAPGIPYVVAGPLGNNAHDVLTLDPGNTFQFTSSGWLYIRGRLNALGLPGQPITFTGQSQAPGAWQGMFIDGGQHEATAQLDYVTIEYGGSHLNGANIEVANGRLQARHTIIRRSQTDGVRFDSNYGGSIQESQIVSNTAYGVRNITPQRAVLASNNWWGDPAGPKSDVLACPAGNGSRVTAGVFYAPVLITPTASAQFPLSSAPILTLTPRRWFAPADNGFTRVYFDVAVTDGNGLPLPNRTVGLATSLGSAVAGGTTDANGHTLAYLTSTTVGEAQVSGSLNVVPCEGYLAPETTVSFTAPLNITDLFPNAQAPYMDDEIQVGPEPFAMGIPATISATLTNPLTVPVTVDINFGFAQAGIGVVFGPIEEKTGQVIPAGSSLVATSVFTPVISGHYCVEVTYNITAVGGSALALPQTGGGSGRRQKNLNVFPGPTGSPNNKDVLNKADKAFNLVSKLPSGPTQIQKGLLGRGWDWAKGAASTISQALGGDPPRQDYAQATIAVRHPFPLVQSDANISVARAAALNAVNDALADIEAAGTAATVALDRYGGASAAANLQWASQQANAQLYYETQMGAALLDYADRVDAYIQVLHNEGITQSLVSASEVISYQQRLVGSGFTGQELADAHSLGWTDDQIEAQRLAIIAADPAAVAGDLLAKYANEATVSRALGNALLFPPTFNPGFHVSGSAGQAPADSTGNIMAHVYNSVSTFQLRNPAVTTATVDLRVRRVNLPGDWTVDVFPAQVTLTPSQTVTITVSVLAASPVAQGAQPRVAVEGYAGGLLLGGMVIDVVVPQYDLYHGLPRLYLPLARR